MAAIRRLDAEARRLEGQADGPSVRALFADERANSHKLGGMSVFGPEPPPPLQSRERNRFRGRGGERAARSRM